jgi:hypothetical protein
MKLAFFKTNELNEMMTVLLKENNKLTRCEVEYSDKLDTDALFAYAKDGKLLSETALTDSIPVISDHLNATVTSYDVIEVGDMGEGFAFFF